MKTERKRNVFKVCLCVLALLVVAGVVFKLSSQNDLDKPLADIPLTDLAATYEGEIKDADGNLLVPFDVAYPEAFATGEYKYDKDVLLLKLKKGFGGKINHNLLSCGFASIERFLKTDDGDWYKAQLSEGTDILVAIQKARSLSEVLVADFDYVYETEAIDYDSVVVSSTNSEAESFEASFDCSDHVKENNLWKDQYNLGKNRVQEAWQFLKKNGISEGGLSSVIVAVIDTGVDYTHPDLKANMWVNKGEIPGNNIDDDGNGYVDDVYGCSTIGAEHNHTGDPLDDHGHGTHVAGIIAASNNKEGVVGIAYNAKIMAVKAGQATGVFNQSDIAEAILYAYQMGADVINMSFGGSACSIAVQDALSSAYTTATLVASAGNDGAPNEGFLAIPNYPAALSYVIGVMSVDKNGVESGFTNYDVITYNAIEYELYAPGEQIMSTLPDGRYGKLSGTSMSAPVVSAAAALLRSYYSDRDMYPSKFIAAQLCATSEETAICCDPRSHGLHNIPMILDIVDALTKLPKPDLQVFDFYVFDPVSYNGVEYESNNGDGVADAGETLLIGLVLRNRWGMSEDTVVTVDTLSSLGVNNPHVEIIDGEVNFEGVGTYSTKSTLIYNEENIITGITDPIIIKLSEKCPNDYLIGINAYIEYKNGLDEKDNTTYHYGEPGWYDVQFWARSGFILPSQITEDMTLTKDNYYIIPNSCYIHEGVTVTVEPGTQIQFWSDDPSDPYAETYIAYLNVAGSFICNGSEEEPIELFPSEMMAAYQVAIEKTDSGTINMSYTTVTNPVIVTDNLDHCTFRYNYSHNLYFRYLSGGNVYRGSGYGYVSAIDAKNCLFYKCGASNPLLLNGNYDSCSFVDSRILSNVESDEIPYSYSNQIVTFLYQTSSFTNCVFMGNHVTDEYGNNYTSTLKFDNTFIHGVENIVRNSATGTSYLRVYMANYENPTYNYVQKLAQSWGGDLACFETEEEWNFAKNKLSGNIGIRSYYDDTWVNGEPIGDFIDIKSSDIKTGIGILSNKRIEFDGNTRYFLIEIPGSIYLDNVYLRENSVKIDDETTYQISASVIPSTFDKSTLIYVSEDENIATVSSTGLITPVSEGETRIFVYSPDYMVYDVLKLQVVEKVPVSDVTFESTDYTIELGDSVELTPVYNPINTTERAVTYSSSAPEIASVDAHGIITAHKVGYATITATAYNGTTDIISVKVSSKIKSLSFVDNFYVTSIGDTDDSWKPVITPADATDYVIKYESSNPEVAYVDDNGNLVRVADGLARIRATVVGSELYDEIEVSVSDNPFSYSDVVCMDSEGNYVLAVTDDGSLWVWGKTIKLPMKIADRIKSAVWGDITSPQTNKYRNISYVDKSGNLGVFYVSINGSNVNLSDVTLDYSIGNLTSVYRYASNFYALSNDGTVWVSGDNSYGQLGIGTNTSVSKPALSNISDVKEIIPYDSSIAFLKNNGELYIAGSNANKYLSPIKIDSGVVDIRGGYCSIIYEKTNGEQYHLDSGYLTAELITDSLRKVQYNTAGNDDWRREYDISFKDGRVYYKNKEIAGISNPEKVFYCNSAVFVVTASGELYGFGENNYYQLADLTLNNRWDRAEKIFFGIDTSIGNPEFEGANVNDGILTDETITLDFDLPIISGTSFMYLTLQDASGAQHAVLKQIYLDKLVITPVYPLVSGEEYTITLPENAVSNIFGLGNSEMSISFTYIDDRSIEFVASDIKDGDILKDGTLNANIEYSYAVAADAFDSISLTFNGKAVEGLKAELKNSVLTLAAEGLAPGEYTLTVPMGALKDNIGGVSEGIIYTLTVPAPEEEVYIPLGVVYSSLASRNSGVALNPQWIIVMNKAFSLDSSLITLLDSQGRAVELNATVDGNRLIISALGLNSDAGYTLTVREGAMTDAAGATVPTSSVSFTTLKQDSRFFWTEEYFMNKHEDMVNSGENPLFTGNAILNNFNDTNVEHWLRLQADEGVISDKVGAGINWWGTTLEEMIERQIIDFDDYQSLLDIVRGDYLTTAPENTFPFVTAAYLLNSSGERVDRVANETVTFVVEFNRDMDTTIPLRVRFGSSLPYGEYEIEGAYVNARRWEGTYTLKTTIENGRQFIRIENGAAADDGYLGLYETPGRFGFELDTTAAQALTMLGEATETGIKLNWTQDDFETLAGYNVYRSTSEDGYYQRLNSYVIPADVKEFFDDTVEPGKRYYYNFTVVQTDLHESTPSGKISIMSMDTMAPDIYHTPVRTAYTGSNLLISATVTDNLGIDTVIVHYRTVGSNEWHDVEMSVLNSRYTGLIPADHIDIAGLEYYIEARDGRNSTFKGSADEPYTVIVKLAVDANSLGDVDGDGIITNRDALMLLQAANDLLNLSEDQFLRADINADGELSAAEALRILQYVSGKVTTIVD